MKTKDGCAGFQREKDWALFGNVFRPPGAINCESAITALADFASHLAKSTKTAAGAGSARSEVSESFDAFGDNVSVAIQAGHDGDPASPPVVRGREDSPVPEREYSAMSGTIDFFEVGVPFGFPAHRASDDADDNVSDPTD